MGLGAQGFGRRVESLFEIESGYVKKLGHRDESTL